MIIDEVKSKGDKKKDQYSYLRPTISSNNQRTNPHPASSRCGIMPKPTKKGSNASAGIKGSLLLAPRDNNRIMPKPNKKLGEVSNSSTNLLDSDIERILRDEITELVLLRLTAMELIRHSKLHPIISSPRFVSAHLKHSKSDPSRHYILVRDRLVIFFERLPPGPLDSNILCCTSEYMVIIGSVNGLICFAGDSRHSMTADDIFIFNPVTRLSKKLPPPSESRITSCARSVKLAFWWEDDDDDSSSSTTGGVYKVAKMVHIPGARSVLELWDSRHPDKWTDVAVFEFDFYGPNSYLPHPCDVLIKGVAAYWIVLDLSMNYSVLSLCLKTLAMELIPISKEQTRVPSYVWSVGGGIDNEYMFGVNMNKRFVLLKCRFSGDRMYDMWTMVRKGGAGGSAGWIKSRRGIRLDFPFIQSLGRINGKLVLKARDDSLAMFDMKTGRRTRVIQDPNMEYVSIDSGHDFVPSLVSIDGFESNELPGVALTWPYPYFDASGWLNQENVEIDA